MYRRTHISRTHCHLWLHRIQQVTQMMPWHSLLASCCQPGQKTPTFGFMYTQCSPTYAGMAVFSTLFCIVMITPNVGGRSRSVGGQIRTRIRHVRQRRRIWIPWSGIEHGRHGCTLASALRTLNGTRRRVDVTAATSTLSRAFSLCSAAFAFLLTASTTATMVGEAGEHA